MSLDPDPEEMRRLGYAAVDRIVDDIVGLPDARVARPPVGADLRRAVGEPLPREGRGLEDSLARLFDDLLPLATRVNHPRFFAYVPGPGSFAGAIGEFCAAATNTFVGTWLGGSVMSQLEVLVLDWLREALGLPAEFGGVLTNGGSMANLTALAAARGRSAATMAETRIYCSTETHYSMTKAATVLGFVPEQVVTIAADPRNGLDADELHRRMSADRAAGITPLLVCATLGTTTTGAVDPIARCRESCDRHAAWLHVDGAYGAASAICEEESESRALLALADSITLDPHKWLYCPFESGVFLTRDIDALQEAFGADAAYMQDVPRDEVNFFLRGPELSRANRALKLWMLVRSVGIDAIAEAVRNDRRLAHHAEAAIAAIPGTHIVTPTSMSVFTFALDAGESAGRALVDALLSDGTTMLSSSRVGGEFVLRFCVANHRTTQRDVDLAVARIRELTSS